MTDCLQTGENQLTARDVYTRNWPNLREFGKKTPLPAHKSAFPLKPGYQNPNWSHRLQHRPKLSWRFPFRVATRKRFRQALQTNTFPAGSPRRKTDWINST